MIDYYWQMRRVRGQERPCFVVNIDGEDWEKCDRFRQWNERDRDVYTRGLIDKPVRVGKLAEMAVGAMLCQEPDFTFRYGGDDHDFLVGGLSIDVKCSVTSNVQCLLMVKSTVGALSSWQNKDLFIVCRLYEIERAASVQVTGFFTVDDVAELPDVPAQRGTHMNKELHFTQSRQLPELVHRLRQRGVPIDGKARWVGEKYGFE